MTNRRRLTDAERFWRHVRRAGPDDCWLWCGCVRRTSGYGAFARQREVAGLMRCIGSEQAHRFAYRDVHGSIPDGMNINHTCASRYAKGDLTGRRCCNPAHLYVGTHLENMADRVRDGRGTALSEERVDSLRSIYAEGGVTQKQLAQEFGVSTGTVSHVINRKAWRSEELEHVLSSSRP